MEKYFLRLPMFIKITTGVRFI